MLSQNTVQVYHHTTSSTVTRDRAKSCTLETVQVSPHNFFHSHQGPGKKLHSGNSAGVTTQLLPQSPGTGQKATLWKQCRCHHTTSSTVTRDRAKSYTLETVQVSPHNFFHSHQGQGKKLHSGNSAGVTTQLLPQSPGTGQKATLWKQCRCHHTTSSTVTRDRAKSYTLETVQVSPHNFFHGQQGWDKKLHSLCKQCQYITTQLLP